jgi:predicted DNA-binding transcriptional regulator AlpA
MEGHFMEAAGLNRAARRAGERQAHSTRMLQTRDLCAHFGVSDRTIYSWTNDKDLKFPQPTIIHGRKYWSEDEILAFQPPKTAEETAETAAEAGS